MTATAGRVAAQGATARASARPAPRVEPRTRPAPRPELRVVARPAHRLGAIGVIGVLVVFAVLFGLVVFHTVLVQNQQRLDHVQEEIRAAQADYQAQRLKVAELESPGRIVAEATQRLGMVTPPGTTYLTPSPAAAAEVGTTAAAANGTAGGDDWPDIKPFLSEQR